MGFMEDGGTVDNFQKSNHDKRSQPRYFKGAIYILLRMGPGIRPTINSLKSQTRTNGGDIRGFKDEQRSFT